MIHVLPRLEVFKALGDNTRYAIYLELAASAHPLATAEIAELLELHPNTVRPHLERMRDVGPARRPDRRPRRGRTPPASLLAQRRRPVARLGTPDHAHVRPAWASTAASLAGGAGAQDALDVGRGRGAEAAPYSLAPSCLEALVTELDRLGFDPTVSAVASRRRDRRICALSVSLARRDPPGPRLFAHRGLVEGLVDAMGDAGVSEFCNLAHRTPCQVAVVPDDQVASPTRCLARSLRGGNHHDHPHRYRRRQGEGVARGRRGT